MKITVIKGILETVAILNRKPLSHDKNFDILKIGSKVFNLIFAMETQLATYAQSTLEKQNFIWCSKNTKNLDTTVKQDYPAIIVFVLSLDFNRTLTVLRFCQCVSYMKMKEFINATLGAVLNKLITTPYGVMTKTSKPYYFQKHHNMIRGFTDR